MWYYEMYKLADIMKEEVGEGVWYHLNPSAMEEAMVVDVAASSYGVSYNVPFLMPPVAVELEIL